MAADDTRPGALVMPADEFAAVKAVAEACGPVASVSAPASDDTGRDLPSAHGQARPRLEALSSDDREAPGRLVREVWVACAREHPDPKPSWLAPWEELGERDKETDRRIGASLALHGASTAAVRMHELHVREIKAAEAKLAEIKAHAPAIVDALRHALAYVEHVPDPSAQAAAERYRSALAITGTGEEPFTPDCGQPTDADRVIAARATGGGIRSHEVQPRFSEEEPQP